MPVDSTFFTGQLEDQKEAWKAKHNDAMECRDLEDLLRTGIALFHFFRMGDASWSREVQSGAAKFDPENVRAISDAYNWWLQPCEAVAKRVEVMESVGFDVAGADDFRKCWRLARKLAAIDAEGLIESMEQIERGEAAELTDEVWDGLPTDPVA